MSENGVLSGRELEILQLVATGLSNKEIAHELYISTNTVKVHLRNIFAKIGVSSRTEAAMYAVQMGIVTPLSEEGTLQRDGSQSDSVSLGEGTIVWGQTGDSIDEDRYFWQYPWLWIGAITIILAIVTGIILFNNYQSTQQGITSAIASEDLSRWFEKMDLPTARRGLAVAVFDNQLIAIGGESMNGITDTVERYHPENDTWDTLPSLPHPITEIQAATLGGKIYIPGGRLPSGDTTSDLHIFDPVNNVWDQGAGLPVPLSAYAMVTFEGKLYIMGGWDGETYRNITYEYDPNSDEWNELTPMPTPRGYAGAAVSAGKIYVIGGRNEDKILTVNEVYSPNLEESNDYPWAEASELPDRRYASGVIGLVENIYILGGETDSDKELEALIFIPQEDRWQAFNIPVEIGSRMGLGSLGSFLYIIGGEIKSGLSNENLAYQAIYTVSIPVIVK